MFDLQAPPGGCLEVLHPRDQRGHECSGLNQMPLLSSPSCLSASDVVSVKGGGGDYVKWCLSFALVVGYSFTKYNPGNAENASYSD